MFKHMTSVMILFALLTVGCQSEKQTRNDQLKKQDPFLGERIPNPNVPTGRDRKETPKDPLMRADKDRPKDEMFEVRPASDKKGSSLTSRSSLASSKGATPEQLKQDLERIGAKVYTPVHRENGYDVRVQLQSATGALSSYTGTGSSADIALRDAYEQLRAER
jgi:hypothetical protein